MKIHQIAPPYIPVNPAITYGGVERVIYHLDDALANLGHDTSMSAPRGSGPAGRLHETIEPIGYGDARKLPELHELFAKLYHMDASLAAANEGDFDIVHVHDENLLPFVRFIDKPVVATMHSIPEEFWDPETYPRVKEVRRLVAVSRRQQEIFQGMGFDVTHVVQNGIDIDAGYFMPEKLDYIFALGIIRPEKGQHTAIEVAERLGKPIIIGGNIGNRAYFDWIKREFTHSIEDAGDKMSAYKNLPPGRKVVYAGHLTDDQKFPLFGGAQAFLIPSVVEEPCITVAIEAMACGTPVVAFRKGGTPELIEDGHTGYIADDIDEMTEMAGAGKISPSDCHARYLAHFTASAMAARYLDVYKEVSPDGQ